MSIRRRINTDIVDIWVTNNSNDVNIIGSLRWAIVQAHNTLHTLIKVAPDFIDLAGVGRNMYVADTNVTNNVGGFKDVTIDFSYTNVIFGTGGSFVGSSGGLSPTFKLQNMVVENQTSTLYLFGEIIDYTNCRFENLVMNATTPYFYYSGNSTITNCIFRNIVNTGGGVSDFSNGTHTVDNCIFDNVGGTYVGSATVNYSRCYINVSDNFVRVSGSPQRAISPNVT